MFHGLGNCDILNFRRDGDKYLESCLKNMVDLHFLSEHRLETIMEGKEGEILKYFPSLVLYNTKQNFGFNLEKTNMYFLYLKYTNSSVVFRKLSNLSTWNPRAKFLIISEIENQFNILKEAAKYLCSDTIVLERNELNEIEVFGWLAYETICLKKFSVQKLDTCVNGTFLNNHNIFPNKNRRHYSGCAIKVIPANIAPYVFYKSDKSLDGLEVRLIHAVEEKTRLKVEFVAHNFRTWGLKLPNGSYTDMFNLLQRNEADAVVGMWPTNYTHSWDFDVSMSYLQDALVWLVPKSQSLPHWKRLSIIFPEVVWLILLVIILTFPLIWAITGNTSYGKELKSFMVWQTCILKSLSVILSVTLPKYPRTSPLRILFITWVYVSLILTTLYQSKLLAILIQPKYEYQISNVDEILSTNMNFGANVNVKSLYDATISQTEKEMHDKMSFCDLTLTCPNRTAFNRDFATAKARLAAVFLILRYYTTSDGVPMVYIFKSTILSHYVNIVFAKGHIVFDRFNQVLWRISESGLFIKWLNDIKEETMRQSIHRDDETKSLALTMEHMSPPFKILIGGYLLSVMIFCLENIYCRFLKNVK